MKPQPLISCGSKSITSSSKHFLLPSDKYIFFYFHFKVKASLKYIVWLILAVPLLIPCLWHSRAGGMNAALGHLPLTGPTIFRLGSQAGEEVLTALLISLKAHAVKIKRYTIMRSIWKTTKQVTV